MKTQGLCSEIFHVFLESHIKTGLFLYLRRFEKNLIVNECKTQEIADMLCCTGYP